MLWQYCICNTVVVVVTVAVVAILQYCRGGGDGGCLCDAGCTGGCGYICDVGCTNCGGGYTCDAGIHVSMAIIVRLAVLVAVTVLLLIAKLSWRILFLYSHYIHATKSRFTT